MTKLKFDLKPWTVAPLILLITAATEFLSIAVQPGVLRQSLADLFSRPLALLLNILPVLLLTALGYFISGNVFWGGGVSSLIALLMSYVNLLKIEGRDDAFVPSDIGLFREALSSAASYDLDLHIPLLIFLLLYCGILFTLGFFVKTPRPKLLWRAVSGGAVCAVFVLAMQFVYPSKAIYNSFTVPNMYNIPSVFNTLGFNYCFLYNFNLYPVDKPSGYSESDIKEWEAQYLAKKTDTDSPNIIMVMGEAFSDISNNDVFTWQSEQDNPAYLYNQLANSDRAISGHIIVSNIAAGTANTEFDILTGTPTTMISDTTTSSFRVVNKSTPTVASVLRDNGYATSFLHPGDSWFYNRSSVYKYFGIDNQVFKDSFDMDADAYAGLVYDSAFLRELENMIDQNESPQFIYSVTIQNHQAYNYAKYPDATQTVPTSRPLSDASAESVSVYLRGVRDTSAMIYSLAQYLDSLSEPTLLVFFGDHMPNIGNDAYAQLGIDITDTDTKTTLDAYKTPFMIYGNTAYCQSHDMAAEKEALELPDSGIINNIYLGAAVLELADYSGHDPYFDFLNYARRKLPVFRTKENAYMLYNGSYTDVLDDPVLTDIVDKVDKWQYNRIR